MAKVLVIYHSQTGNTEEMAKAVSEGVSSIAGAEAVLKKAMDANVQDLFDCDAFAFGTPTYGGYMAGMVKDFFDRIAFGWVGQGQPKPFACFGSAGGDTHEGIASIEALATAMQLQKTADSVKATMKASPEVIEQCKTLGKTLATK